MNGPGGPFQRVLLAVIAGSLVWLALRPHVAPDAAEASRHVLTVNLEQVGGRTLYDGLLPIRCGDRRP